MKGDFLHLAFAACVLVFAASGEELLPKPCGVGVPLLMGSVLVVAANRPLVSAVLFAAAAGGIEDAISSLPLFTSVGFFLLAGVFVRMTELRRATIVAAYPCYQLWLSLGVDFGGGMFARLLVALPLGLLAGVLLMLVLPALERKAALDA